jgi:hypothetical protein
MKKKEKLAEMIAELAWAKKEAKRQYRVGQKNRAKARAADNNVCRLCGFPLCPEVHHVVPSSRGGSNKLSNLITLCPNHHAMADRGLIPIEELNRAAAQRTRTGRMSAVGEVLAYIARTYAVMHGESNRLQELRALLKTELPSRFAAIYGPLDEQARSNLYGILDDHFDHRVPGGSVSTQ